MNSQDLIKYELQPKDKAHLQNQKVYKGGDILTQVFIRCCDCAKLSKREQCEVVCGALECPHCHRLMSW